jgi:hypothetical protein
MRLSLLAPSLAIAAAVAIPAPESDLAVLTKRDAAIQPWDLTPNTFDTIPEPVALHEKPKTAKDAATAGKREADAVYPIPNSKQWSTLSYFDIC